MKNNSYFVKGIVGLSLIGGIVFANDIEIKDLKIKSSVQQKNNVSEAEEIQFAKLDVNDVCKILKKEENGKIVKVALENDDGNLVYHSEIYKNINETVEVIIDAGDGKILHKELDHRDKEEENDDENSEHNKE